MEMSTKRDYYEVLGIERTASDGEIARAYRKLAIKYHPDSNSGDEEATLRFKEVAEAYEVLSDTGKRSRYDQFGHAGVGSPAGGGGFADAEDIMDAFGDIFGGSVFGDIFGGGRRRNRGSRRGADLKCEVVLDLEEAARGIEKEIEFDRHFVCETCSGSGSRPGTQDESCRRCGGRGQVVQSAGILRVQTTCPSCGGRGRVISTPCLSCQGRGLAPRRVKLKVKIPPGVDDGTRVRIPGEGEPSREGGVPGDCYCFIRVREHPLFKRDGCDLFVQLPITFTQAALGAKIEIPTLDGPDELTVPAGTQSGELFRLARHGIRDPRHGRMGDLIVQIFVEVPKKLTPRQVELLRELADEEHVHVSPHRKSFLEKLRDYFAPHASEEE
jgi:molecular chaperone DnaJ